MRGPIKRQTLAVLRQRGVPVQTVLDVGVLSGTPELLAAYPDRLHLLFEPVVEFTPAIEQLYQNVRHKLIPAAVSDSSGTVPLRTTSIIPGLPISHSYMIDSIEESTRVVPMVSLDDYLRDNPAEPPYFLKVDIDGHEMKVLRGAGETLKRTSVVMIEAPVDSLVERVGYLMEAGFRLFDLTEPCYYDNSLWQCDAVLIRKDIHDERFAALHENFDPRKYATFNPS
jgi:FkbM family methyltransferase